MLLSGLSCQFPLIVAMMSQPWYNHLVKLSVSGIPAFQKTYPRYVTYFVSSNHIGPRFESNQIVCFNISLLFIPALNVIADNK